MTTQSTIRLLSCYIILFSENDRETMKQDVRCRRTERDATTQIMLLDDSLNVVTVAWLKQCCNQHSAAPNHTAETWTIVFVPHIVWNRDSVVGIVTALRDEGPFRPALGPTQPPSQHIPKAFSWGQNGQGIKIAIFLHPVPRLKISGAKPPLEHMFSWHTHVQLYFNSYVHPVSFCPILTDHIRVMLRVWLRPFVVV